jgi:hypothetical protein
MATVPNGYQPIVEIYREAGRAQDAGAIIAALAMIFVGIDTMAWLSLPLGEDSVRRAHFCAWVDSYLKADQEQPYQYVGIDVYAARCAMLHHYGIMAELHNNPNPPKKFGYLDNGPHRTDGSELVLISIAVLVHDFGKAVVNFIQAALQDAELKARIDSRVQQLVSSMPVRAQAQAADAPR